MAFYVLLPILDVFWVSGCAGGGGRFFMVLGWVLKSGGRGESVKGILYFFQTSICLPNQTKPNLPCLTYFTYLCYEWMGAQQTDKQTQMVLILSFETCWLPVKTGP